MLRAFRVLKSWLIAARASRRYGQACGLLEAGRKPEALREARAVLELLGRPYVIRTNPPEASLFVCTAILLESLACELQASGINRRDLPEVLYALRQPGTSADLAAWIPHLESRLGQAGTSAV
jgi:hypothetical protein